jgi:thymidine kinase
LPDETYPPICEVCGADATHWVRDLFETGSDVASGRWMTGKWHAFCREHWRPSRSVNARTGGTIDDGTGYYVERGI